MNHHGFPARLARIATATALVIGMGMLAPPSQALVAEQDALRTAAPATAAAPAVAQNAVFSWGQELGGLGTGLPGNNPTPTAVIPYSGLAGKQVTAISTNTSQTCAIASGQVVCWGPNPMPMALGNAVAGLTPTALSVGEDHSCGIFSGKAFCWGYTMYGALGAAVPANSYVPQPVPVRTDGVLAGRTIQVISAGRSTTCALADGRPYCWGFGLEGQLGDGGTPDASRSYPNSDVPVAVDTSGALAGKTITDIATGGTGSCALASGQVYCWGDAETVGSDQYIDGSPVPVAVDTSGVLHGRTVTDLSVGAGTVCVVADAEPFCWGANGNDALGGGPGGTDNGRETHPVAVLATGALAGKAVTEVHVGIGHVCVLAAGAVYCWGGNGSGEMGLGTFGGNDGPEPVYTAGALAGRTITGLAVGDRQTYVITPQPPAKVVTPGSLVPLPANRLLDDRPGGIAANGSTAVQVTGRGGVPTSGVSAVVANVTAVASSSGGYLSVAADGAPKPPTSTLNFGPKEVVANLAVIPVGVNGRIRVYNNSPAANPVLIDVTGYYVGGTPTTPGTYVVLAPTRLVDTRPVGIYPGTNESFGNAIAGIPQNGAVAVNANITAISTQVPGELGVNYLNHGGFTSAVAFGEHDVVANMFSLTFNISSNCVIVNKSVDNALHSRTNAVVDVNGYFTAGSPYAPGTFSPVRPVILMFLADNGIAGSASLPVQIAGLGGVPSRAVAAVVLHVVVAGGTTPGYLSVGPDGAARPTTSVLNFGAGQSVSNTVIVPMGADGKIRLYNFARTPVKAQVNVTGYYRTGGL